MNDLFLELIMPSPAHLAHRAALTASIGRHALVGDGVGLFWPAIIRSPGPHADMLQVTAFLNAIMEPDTIPAVIQAISAGTREILVLDGLVGPTTADDRASAAQCTHIDLSRPGSCTVSVTLCGQLSSQYGRPSLVRLDHHARPVSACWHDFGDALEIWQHKDGPLALTIDGNELADLIRHTVETLDALGSDTMQLSALADHAELAAEAGRPVNLRMKDGVVNTLALARELRCITPPSNSWTRRP